MRSSEGDPRTNEQVGSAVGILVLIGILLWGYPQIGIGIAVGTLCAVPLWTRLTKGDAASDEWRSRAGWVAAGGIAVAVAYFALRGAVGADVEARRFDRRWGLREIDWDALVDHPWGWLPIAAAVAFVVFSGIVYWAASRR